MGFSRQEHRSGLPYPSPEDLPDPGIAPKSPALQADSLPGELLRKPPGSPRRQEREQLKDRWTDALEKVRRKRSRYGGNIPGLPVGPGVGLGTAEVRERDSLAEDSQARAGCAPPDCQHAAAT